jgi:hypothetical protein
MTSSHKHGTGKAAVAGDVDPTIANLTAQVSSLTAQVKALQVPSSPGPILGPSGIPMPTTEPAGWSRIFSDDFPTTIPEGQFPAATNGKWGAYPYGWSNNYTGTYDPSIISTHDSVLDMHLRTTNGVVRIANPVPLIPSNLSDSRWKYQISGRYQVCFRADPVEHFKTAWLLWPMPSTGAGLSEIDHPEGPLTGTISAFMHYPIKHADGHFQDAYSFGVTYAGWHVAVIEWIAGVSCAFILDGVVKKSSVGADVPTAPMRWCLQTETALDFTPPPPDAQGHVLVDWVTVAARA